MIAKYSLMASLCPRIKQVINQPIGIYKPPIILFLLVLCFVFAAKAQEIEVHSTPVTKAGKRDNIKNILTEKRDYKIEHDINTPFLINGNGGDGSNLIYHSVLTGYQKGLSARTTHAIPVLSSVNQDNMIKGYRIGCYNTSLKSLYRLAFFDGKTAFRNNQICVEVENSIHLESNAKSSEEYVDWLSSGNGYSYEAIVPHSLGRKAVYVHMQEDLAKFFPQYKVSIEKRLTDCLVLVRTSNLDKISTNGGKVDCKIGNNGFIMTNYYPPSYFVERLHYYLQNHPPLIDGTGYTDKIDIVVNANLSNVSDINKELEKYDLKIIEEEREIDMLVIKDSGIYPLPLVSNRVEIQVDSRDQDWNSLEERRGK